jgi:hypothetical protein
MLFEYLDTVIYDLFPNHTATRAYDKYKAKKTKSTLEVDCKAIYTTYKKEIINGNTKWLKNNVVVIGTKSSGIYLSMIYNKTDDDELIDKFIEYLRSIDKDIDDELESSDSDSSSDDDETALDIIKEIYQSIQPKLSDVVATMEMPPPDGVILSKKTKEIKQADILAVKKGIAEFESVLK